MKRVSVETYDGQHYLVVRIPIEVTFENSCVTVKESNLPFALNARERDVLAGICSLKRNKEIASDLNLSERTVKFHVSRLMRKTKIGRREELAARFKSNPETVSVQ